MSPRTARYVEAMVREGFDYNEWLKEVREQEAEAKQAPTAVNPRDVVAVRIDNPNNASRNPALNPKALRRRHQEDQIKTPKTRLRRRLEKVHRAWGDFQSSRRRDAVYQYLGAVLALVMHYRVRRRTNRLLRHAFKFANLRFDENADPFTAIIRSTSDDSFDSKMISKWARALRYVARCKKSEDGLRTFIKKAGGINGCAARYAHRNGRTC
jgi:hypothetical protein